MLDLSESRLPSTSYLPVVLPSQHRRRSRHHSVAAILTSQSSSVPPHRAAHYRRLLFSTGRLIALKAMNGPGASSVPQTDDIEVKLSELQDLTFKAVCTCGFGRDQAAIITEVCLESFETGRQ